jgi:putative nucleotidyltransferase with HDIG domain
MATVEARSAPSRSIDDDGTELVERARARSRRALARSDEAVALALGGAFVLAAVAATFLLPSVRPFSLPTAVVAVAVYAVVSRVHFEVGNGFALPTQLVLVPMLFALPPRSVPLLVAAALVLAETPAIATKAMPAGKVPLLLANGWHALGPAVVLSLAVERVPSLHHVPVYAGALAAQFCADFVPSAVWSRAAWNVSVTAHARAMRVPVLVDLALAPIGLTVALAAGAHAWSVLLVLPLVGLIRVFARERQVRIDHALELSGAYRGTAMLLGDVIEADDEYTGSHSRDVVELVVAVANRLGVGPADLRQAEFAALLHDVGKVKIPAEIINKPGPLDDDERALMNTHTILGEEMLDQIGGLLGETGRIVRSCHERWDGLGYPDGLAAEQIPLVARIVCACDAWSAMTTDRSYRKARSPEEAAQELRASSGSHFDPAVVGALLAVVGP